MVCKCANALGTYIYIFYIVYKCNKSHEENNNLYVILSKDFLVSSLKKGRLYRVIGGCSNKTASPQSAIPSFHVCFARQWLNKYFYTSADTI